MKILKWQLILSLILFPIVVTAQSGFYDFKVKTLEGEDFNLASLKGKKVMVVNTASKCGYTPQYKDLEELYKQYNGKLIIIGFPANNFLNQEPGSALEIRQFCTDNYSVTFPLMEKISVKGNDMHPLYKWLTTKSLNGVMDSEVKWNFQKYLIDENGKLVDVLYSKEKPGSEKVIAWLGK
ncbi:MAG: redoxin domain-containing protein [Bacteroidales bacterium]|jgi:glutathione peroxidase|nr:redoxin domain-containing protein [Bacteroidales bacterium]NMD01970.1 glutathione peroxidase [Bacteroidales bacterium]OQB64970.1 MAG: Hydroperoxy fatty acid reductase gpx1 [Bacteroidetes bacterium ADurb.Bin145]